jgi:putative NADH-flavin reductase
MKLLIIGATGMIGSRLVAEAESRGHSVVAASRKGSTVGNAQPLSLEVTDVEAVVAAAQTVDLVITAVSPRTSGNAMDDALGYGAALIEAAPQIDKRLMVVGGAGTLNLPDGTPVADVVPEPYQDEAKAMRAMYEMLAKSTADFTFMAPAGMIEPGERTGVFRLGQRAFLTDDEGNSQISAEDYAVAFMDEVEVPKHPRQVFTAAY